MRTLCCNRGQPRWKPRDTARPPSRPFVGRFRPWKRQVTKGNPLLSRGRSLRVFSQAYAENPFTSLADWPPQPFFCRSCCCCRLSTRILNSSMRIATTLHTATRRLSTRISSSRHLMTTTGMAQVITPRMNTPQGPIPAQAFPRCCRGALFSSALPSSTCRSLLPLPFQSTPDDHRVCRGRVSLTTHHP